MNVDIDFEVLEQTGMSADDYLYLYVIHKESYAYLNNLNLKPNLEKLQEDGYIKLGETPDQHFIRQEFIALFSSNFDQMFAELISTYPMKVMTTDRGVRVLHAKDPDSKANARCKAKYRKIVGDKVYKHKHIMKCLDTQLTMERNNLAYMQNLETWINNHTWEKYENINENDKRTVAQRITRSL